MFDTCKFGGYLSRLRKKADMTQSALADKLNVTRQTISRYELGESFPDVSILVLLADIFHVTLDELISSGEPTRGESMILRSVARGDSDMTANSLTDLINLAPYLKPSVLGRLSDQLAGQGIDLSHIVSLAAYLQDENVIRLLENNSFGEIGDDLLGKLIPLLDEHSKSTIFQKILDGEMDWHLIRVLLVHEVWYLGSQIEAAVLEGALPWEALDVMREALQERFELQRKREFY